MDTEKIIQLLKKEMVVAMGCTEPAAAALAGSKAAELLGCAPERVTAYASRDMMKNAMSVGIPNCEERGLLTAVCLGIYSQAEKKDLSILSSVSEEQRQKAAALVAVSHLELAEKVPPVYVRVVAEGGGHTASCTVSREHDRFTELVRDGEVIFKEDPDKAENCEEDTDAAASMSLQDVLDFAATVDKKQVAFVLESARTNRELARYSVEHDYGLKVARTVLSDVPETPTTLGEAMTHAAAYAAAGSDARMSGCPRPVVINSGSGNQGITCTVPVLILAEYLGTPEDKLLEALCISELVGLLITARKDRLSALCGAFTAAMGAGCGMVHLMGGGIQEMNLVIRTMVGNLAGIVCDGAKTSCALKIYSSVQAAALAVRMAFQGEAPGRESGIIGADAMESIDNLMSISHKGMVDTDKVILSIMLDKQI
ncbi:MAG: L-serine ammonia-lyase, iron-sulfur-dependent, subunit alpha [Clostridiales bacterium]|nr:L-serine ammonia-lyase, iron-sulfur-dependent, subunit alpha [Clostridiales bacterium]